MNFHRHILPLLSVVTLMVLGGCIHNDIPYPRIPQLITAIEAEGQEGSAVIDADNYTVTIPLAETTDPRSVKFVKWEYTEGAEASVNLLDGTYNLTSPLKVQLSLYQTYDWLISISQTITRELAISGQVGATVIDDVGRRIIVRVPENFNLTDLTLTAIKLGPEGITTMVPALAPGKVDLSRPLKVEVTYFGETSEWTIYCERTRQIVATSQVDAWARVIWAYGAGPEDGENGFQYRRVGDDEWIDVPDEWVTHNGGSFTARIIHLSPLTQYEVRAVSGENIGNEVTVTTEATAILPDGNFDQWWLDGKVWCPWDEFGVQYWDTGNTGASSLGQSNVLPTDYTPTGSGRAAMLETRFVGIGMVGKLAAGSIYTGKFKSIKGTHGILDFGQPWSEHPTRLKGYYQYKSAPINYASDDYKYLLNRPDSCHIYIILADWNEPFEIRTDPKNQHLLDFSSPDIIAYGGITTSASSDSYIPFDIELQYRSTSRPPRYILVCAAASKYGDYFTGGTGATLYIDQLSLEYDYE